MLPYVRAHQEEINITYWFVFNEATYTVRPECSDPPEKIFNTFASENEVYTIYQLLQYFRLNIISLQSKVIPANKTAPNVGAYNTLILP